MNQDDSITLKRLHNLIEHSTDFRFRHRAHFKQLHVALIKEFFNASSALIDIENNQIFLGIDELQKGAEVSITFDNLEKFLKSCIRNTPECIAFYSNLLHYYTSKNAVA